MIYIVHKNNIHPVTQNENKDAYPIEMAANWNMIHNVTNNTILITTIKIMFLFISGLLLC